jgi:hypothetical protein
VWRLYGWFCGLMCCGSCLGAVTWGVWLQFLVSFFTLFGHHQSNLPDAESFALLVQVFYFLAAWNFIYPIAFFCLSVSKLLVLDRMKQFAVHDADGVSRRWVLFGRVVIGVVVLVNAVGLAGGIASSIHWKNNGDAANDVFSSPVANNSDAFIKFNALVTQTKNLGFTGGSVQEFCEATVLLFILTAFAVAGIACVRLMNASLHSITLDAGVAGRQVRRQIVGTATFVFVTFLLRAVYATMFAIANALEDRDINCPFFAVPCSACYNEYKLMEIWMIYTPEFQLSVELISSPLALLVALWGMTSERTLQLMQSTQRQAAPMLDYTTSGLRESR